MTNVEESYHLLMWLFRFDVQGGRRWIRTCSSGIRQNSNHISRILANPHLPLA